MKAITSACIFLGWIVGALLGTPVNAGESSLTRYQYTQLHMGVQVRIVLYARDKASAERATIAAFRRFAELEDVMSDYRPTSELMRLCARAGGPPVRVSPDLFRVLTVSQDISRRSGGAFDVTVGPLVQLWRQARRTKQMPSADALADARRRVGWQKMTLDPADRTVKLEVAGMRLDLGGIAKGYAGDEALKTLRAYGVDSALIEAGGDIVCSGPPPGRRGWTVAVANAGRGDFAPVVEVAHEAVSTSGDTEQYIEIDGKRYSHVMDPFTGMGLTNRAAATVIAPAGVLSDPLSTTVTILGPEKGRALMATLPRTTVYIRTATD